MRASVLLVLAGCNQVFGLDPTLPEPPPDGDLRADFDNDGIADEMDDCIAGAFDQSVDTDFDGLMADDTCPFDALANPSPDADNDGIPDICDPFPATPGDHHRCTMTFASADLNQLLWQPRAGELPWGSGPGSLRSDPNEVQSVVAVETIEAPRSTTFDIRGIVNSNSGNPLRSFGVWLRAASVPSATDLRCEVTSDNVASHLVIFGGGGGPLSSVAGPPVLSNGTFKIVATLEPSANQTNVSCRAIVEGTLTSLSLMVAGRVSIPGGQFGFFAEHMYVLINRAAIYDRAVDALP